MAKKISVLGSTGSIGTQSLDVIEKNKELSLYAISANKNIKLLEEQARKFLPKLVCVYDKSLYPNLKQRLFDLPVKVTCGDEGLYECAASAETDMVLTALVGIAGLKPTLWAIEAKKDIALSNKETLVTAGHIVMQKAKENNVRIIPVDSEHSAIFQCLDKNQNEIKNIIITASGGVFYGKTKKELENVTVADALKHPNWAMGKKITIDSATLMNKGLEVIEACHLFNVPIEKIKVVIHRQSIIHSMVEFMDNSIIAQLGAPDMRIPISYALCYPKRMNSPGNELDIYSLGSLTFEKPDFETFPCLSLAISAYKTGGSMPAVLNGANEEAVLAFLEGKCKFLDIPRLVQCAMQNHKVVVNPALEDIIDSDMFARECVRKELVK
ncbi:MAG: 1-deoxy-D-xylulose-5-phosphate reductoisomerase [Clostridiaceae bacterium]|nr:1-deoxy-D-xylulose-5-phosphate reductoisomerase [Clostridiaceae bacterium]